MKKQFVLLMVLLFVLATSLLPQDLFAQTTVNGKVQGMLWRTTDAHGEVEVTHAWGRTAHVPVTGAWVVVHDGTITVGAKTPLPLIDGEYREGYSAAQISGPLDSQWPTHVQTLTKKEIIGVGDGKDIVVVTTAIIVFDDKSDDPLSLTVTRYDYALFDIQEFIRQIRGLNHELANRTIQSLVPFDAKGRMQKSYYAKFDKSSRTDK